MRFSTAMDSVFLVGAIILVCALVLAFFLKEVPLRSQSGLQAQRVAEGASAPAVAAGGDFVAEGGASVEEGGASPRLDGARTITAAPH